MKNMRSSNGEKVVNLFKHNKYTKDMDEFRFLVFSKKVRKILHKNNVDGDYYYQKLNDFAYGLTINSSIEPLALDIAVGRILKIDKSINLYPMFLEFMSNEEKFSVPGRDFFKYPGRDTKVLLTDFGKLMLIKMKCLHSIKRTKKIKIDKNKYSIERIEGILKLKFWMKHLNIRSITEIISEDIDILSDEEERFLLEKDDRQIFITKMGENIFNLSKLNESIKKINRRYNVNLIEFEMELKYQNFFKNQKRIHNILNYRTPKEPIIEDIEQVNQSEQQIILRLGLLNEVKKGIVLKKSDTICLSDLIFKELYLSELVEKEKIQSKKLRSEMYENSLLLEIEEAESIEIKNGKELICINDKMNKMERDVHDRLKEISSKIDTFEKLTEDYQERENQRRLKRKAWRKSENRARKMRERRDEKFQRKFDPIYIHMRLERKHKRIKDGTYRPSAKYRRLKKEILFKGSKYHQEGEFAEVIKLIKALRSQMELDMVSYTKKIGEQFCSRESQMANELVNNQISPLNEVGLIST